MLVFMYLQGTSNLDYQQQSISVQDSEVNLHKLCHERTVKRFLGHLTNSRDRKKLLGSYFGKRWKDRDHDSRESVFSRSGLVIIIMHAGCPITWCSRLQTKIALNTTKTKYIAISAAIGLYSSKRY